MKALNRFLAGIFAIGLAAVGLLVAVETAAALIGRPAIVPYERWLETGGGYQWRAPEVLRINAVLMTGGVLLIVLQILPRRGGLSTEFDLADSEVRVDRSAMERSLARAATGVEGVQRAKSRARTKRVLTTLEVGRGGDGKITAAVEQALRKRLEKFRIKPAPRISVTARARGRAR